MIVYLYDKTFEGLLTCLFEAYASKIFPDAVVGDERELPLLYDRLITITTDTKKSNRVWTGLKRKLSKTALQGIEVVWLSELPESEMLLMRYMRKAIDAPQRVIDISQKAIDAPSKAINTPQSIETNFGDSDVLLFTQIYKKVMHERLRLTQFARFQKTADGIYFAAFEPIYNALPLTIAHFADRFADQQWIVYDLRRKYGYHYDLHQTTEITLSGDEQHLQTGKLSQDIMSTDEQHFQQLWKTYFKAICIRERINPRLHRHNMPTRFWRHLTEKQ